jgi:hypothetical protein
MKSHDRARILGAVTILAIAVSPLEWKSLAHAAESDALFLKVENGMVTADVRGAPLASVLAEMSRAAGIEAKFSKDLGRRPLWVVFKEQPLRKALREFLRDTSYVFSLPQGTDDGSSNVNMTASRGHLLVLGTDETPLGEPISVQEEPMGSSAPDLDITRLTEIYANDSVLHDPDPSKRVAELRASAERYGRSALPLVLSALGDSDAQVRLASLGLIEEGSMGPVPPDTLARVSLRDENGEVRLVALKLLADGYMDDRITPATLELALSDADPAVQMTAADVLAQYETGDDSSAGTR